MRRSPLLALLWLAAPVGADGLPPAPYAPRWSLDDAQVGTRGRPLGWQGWTARAVLSADTGRLLLIDGQGRGRLVDTRQGNPRALPWLLRGAALVHDVPLALAGGVLYVGHEDRVRRWRLADGRRLADWPTGPPRVIQSLAVSPDGRQLAATQRGVLTLWELPAGTRQTLEQPRLGFGAELIFSADGRELMASDIHGALSLWHVPQRRLRRRWVGANLGRAALSADGRWLLSVGERDGEALTVRDARTFERVAARGRGLWPSRPVGLSVGRRWLALYGPLGVSVLRADGGGRPLRLDIRDAIAAGWSPAGHWLTVVGHRGGVWRFHPASGALFSPTGHVGGVAALVAGPGGRWLASLGVDQTVRLWDPRSGWQHAIGGGTPEQPGGRLSALARSPDGRWLVAGGRTLLRLRVPDLALAGPRFEPPASTVRALAWTPDGRTLIGAGDAGDVELWDAASGRRRGTLRGLRGPVLGLAVDPRGRWLAAGGWDARGIAVWSLPDGATIGRIATGWAAVHALAVRPDGRLAVATEAGLRAVSLRGPLRRLDVPAPSPGPPTWVGLLRHGLPHGALVSRDGRRPLGLTARPREAAWRTRVGWAEGARVASAPGWRAWWRGHGGLRVRLAR